jgi:hypothetical protein
MLQFNEFFVWRGFGIYFQGKWAQKCWPKEWKEMGILKDITFLELFPAILFEIPEICKALIIILYCKFDKTRCLTRDITLTDFEDFLLIMFYFQGKWAQKCWPKLWEEMGILKDITFLELFPVVVALCIWGNS